MNAPVLASVVIPTLDGDAYLARVLDAAHAQRLPDGEPPEIIVIDSGSSDATLDIVRGRPWVRLHQIDRSQFGHGRTRNAGARLARGEFVAFLSQDAIPVGSEWLSELIAPLMADERTAGCVGRQEPRRRCFPLLKYEIRASFARLSATGEAVVVGADDAASLGEDAVSFYSDVNSAARRRILTEVIPYRDVQYAEDIAFARDILSAGYRKAYAPRAVVEHSNDLRLSEYGRRIFDEAVGLRRIGAAAPTPGAVGWLAHAAWGAMRDSVRIVRDSDYSAARTAYWLVVNPAFHLVKWRGYRRAARVDLGDHSALARWSLERGRGR